MRFPTSSASLNAQEAKPAIVQAAKRNCAWYKNEIKRLALAVTKNAHEYRKAVSDFKDSGAWKEEFKTWGEASREVLDLSPQRSNQLIRELTENYYEVSESPLSDSPAAKLPPKSHISEPVAPEPKEEEPEKPAVHSADEVKQPEPKAHTNGHVVRAENGRPKQSLAAWRELEESLIGRAINRADGLNRLCPNTQMHARLVASLKASLTILEQWKQSVQ